MFGNHGKNVQEHYNINASIIIQFQTAMNWQKAEVLGSRTAQRTDRFLYL